MMNYSQSSEDKETLDIIFQLLNEDTLAKRVYEPIDCAANTFQCKVAVPITHNTFNRVISAFIQHLYQSGLHLARYLSDSQALAEAIFLLNKGYNNDEASGYDGALLDANGKRIEGLEMVLAQLAETVKTAERIKYEQWVFACHVYHRDWQERKRMVSVFLKRNGKFLPGELVNLGAARLTAYLPDLILNHM